MANSTLTPEQAQALYWVARYARGYGGLVPRPIELASLMKTNEVIAIGRLQELHERGFFITLRGLTSFHTKAAAMYAEEAAVIIVASDLGDESGRPWVAKDEIEAAVNRRYKKSAHWRVENLLEAAVKMDYLTADGNGVYECTAKVSQHWPYLKFLLRPPRPSPSRRKL